MYEICIVAVLTVLRLNKQKHRISLTNGQDFASLSAIFCRIFFFFFLVYRSFNYLKNYWIHWNVFDRLTGDLQSISFFYAVFIMDLYLVYELGEERCSSVHFNIHLLFNSFHKRLKGSLNISFFFFIILISLERITLKCTLSNWFVYKYVNKCNK